MCTHRQNCDEDIPIGTLFSSFQAKGNSGSSFHSASKRKNIRSTLKDFELNEVTVQIREREQQTRGFVKQTVPEEEEEIIENRYQRDLMGLLFQSEGAGKLWAPTRRERCIFVQRIGQSVETSPGIRQVF